MKQIPFNIFCLAFCGLFFACNSNQENIAVESSAQNTLLPQSTIEVAQTLEPISTPLTEKDLKRRAEVHKLMLKGEYLHDGSGELASIGDINSVPALLVVLKKHPPMSNGSMVCTTAHAVSALKKLTGADVGYKYEDWNAWWGKYQEEQKVKEK
jgi:hypothetical protein